MLWYNQGVCKYDKGENRVRGKTLEECKAMCLETVGCNAIHWADRSDLCDRLECPNPIPSPKKNGVEWSPNGILRRKWQGFHLNPLAGE